MNIDLALCLINRAFQVWRNKCIAASRGLMKINLSRLMVKVIASTTSKLKVSTRGAMLSVHPYSHNNIRKSIAKTDLPRITFKKMVRLGRKKTG